MNRKARFAVKAVLGLAAMAVLGGVVMWLWNAVMPTVFVDARSIDFPRALGLLVLSRILFGGFHGWRGRGGHRSWARWQAMTPEERAQLRSGGPCGGRRVVDEPVRTP
jgi:hypothetical protein